MKKLLLFLCIMLLSPTGWATTKSGTSGEDIFILGGELSNSAATSVEDIER